MYGAVNSWLNDSQVLTQKIAGRQVPCSCRSLAFLFSHSVHTILMVHISKIEYSKICEHTNGKKVTSIDPLTFMVVPQ